MKRWEHKQLSEICGFQRGLTYAKSDEVDAPGHTVLRANNIDLTSHELDFSELKFISGSVSIPASKIVRPGSLIVCTASGSKAHLGKVAYIDSDYGHAFGGFMGQLTPSKGVDGRYLFYALISPGYKDFIAALSDGVNINNLKSDDLGRYSVPLPPHPEQRRIVAILDEAFEAIAIAKANTEKNLQNAAELRAVNLQRAFTEPKSGWIPHKLGELISIQNGYAFKSGDYSVTGHFVMRIGNVQDGEITLANPRFIKLDGTGLQRFALNEDDILVSLTGNIGRVGIIRPEHLPAVLNQRVARITPRGNEIEGEFLFKYLSSRTFRENLSSAGHGAAQQNVSTKEIEAVCIYVPPLSEQSRITEIFSEFETRFEVLDTLLKRKLTALDELKKSLLHRAFTGQLTAKSIEQQMEAVA